MLAALVVIPPNACEDWRREDDGLRAKTRHRLRAHVLLQRRFDIIDDGVILRAE